MLLRNIKIEADEKILLQVRRHWFVFFLQTLPIILLAIAPMVLWRAAEYFFGWQAQGKYVFLAFFFYTIWLLFLWVTLFIKWSIYYLDIWVLTNKRVFDLQQKTLFSREVSVLRLEKIEDITIHVEGLFPTVLNYGDIEVETAGAETFKFVIATVSNPYDVKNRISSAHDAAMEHMHHSK